jgi:hypothetical protein
VNPVHEQSVHNGHGDHHLATSGHRFRPVDIVAETLACAWEYTRCVIPQFTNWDRYLAFTRIIDTLPSEWSAYLRTFPDRAVDVFSAMWHASRST